MAVLSTERTERRVGSMVARSIMRAARSGNLTAEASALPARASAEMMILDFMVVVLTPLWG
jgi:hypothetical protein